jgi:hypothetical protein
MNMNVQFQALLKERNFPMQIIEEEEQFVYKGRLTISQNFIVDFVASLIKGEGDTPGQIVFQNIATMAEDETREQWLNWLNQLNLYHSLYYYFASEANGKIFARYVTQVNHVEDFFYILSKGGTVVRNVVATLDNMRAKSGPPSSQNWNIR